MYKKILYPIKFEEFFLDILRYILGFKGIGLEEIVFLHVIDVSKLPMDRYEGYSPVDVESLKAIAEEKMEEAVKVAEDAGLKTKEMIRVGLPYKEILKIIEEEPGISIVVSGREKKSPLKEIFIGSNTDRIIRYGNVPVFVPNIQQPSGWLLWRSAKGSARISLRGSSIPQTGLTVPWLHLSILKVLRMPGLRRSWLPM